MRLADFIVTNLETIVIEWESFARTCTPGAEKMTRLALKDHAAEILSAIALDLRSPQSAAAELRKTQGRAPVVLGTPDTAAQTHAVLRARAGFSINQLVSEYRALRGSVLRLWADGFQRDGHNYVDLMRFNEAIDQAVAESVDFFETYLNDSRNLLLGMLGHDMRTPLWSIKLTAEYLSRLNAGESVSDAAAVLIRSGAAIQALLDDLVDFNRTRLGLGINISPEFVDLGELVAGETEILRSAHPDANIELEIVGKTTAVGTVIG